MTHIFPAPVNDAVKYEKVVWYDNIDHFSPWQLAPDDALDELWSGLYSGEPLSILHTHLYRTFVATTHLGTAATFTTDAIDLS